MRIQLIPIAIATLFAASVSGQPPADQAQEKVYHFTNTGSEQGMHEIATVVRSIADIRQVSVDTQQKIMTVRTTASQIALADWMFNLLDRTTNPPDQPTGDSAQLEYQVSGSGDAVRVFYLKNTASVQNLQEVATTTRSILDMRRLFTYNALRAIAARGTSEQISAAEWLLNDLDRSTSAQPQQNPQGEHQYWLSPGELLRVIYVPSADSVQRFQQIATYVRTTTQVRWLFTYNAPRAMAVRGTPEQIAQAEQLVKEQQ